MDRDPGNIPNLLFYKPFVSGVTDRRSCEGNKSSITKSKNNEKKRVPLEVDPVREIEINLCTETLLGFPSLLSPSLDSRFSGLSRER